MNTQNITIIQNGESRDREAQALAGLLGFIVVAGLAIITAPVSIPCYVGYKIVQSYKARKTAQLEAKKEQAALNAQVIVKQLELQIQQAKTIEELAKRGQLDQLQTMMMTSQQTYSLALHDRQLTVTR